MRRGRPAASGSHLSRQVRRCLCAWCNASLCLIVSVLASHLSLRLLSVAASGVSSSVMTPSVWHGVCLAKESRSAPYIEVIGI